jgi:hypothetical protein
MANTLPEVQARIVEVKAALSAAYTGLSYGIGDRQLTRQRIEDLRNELTILERQESALQAQANGSNKPAALACWNCS